MKTTAVIMAGGKGERFWPRSRSSFPKQFLSLTNDKNTMIQLTVDRISSLVEPKDIYISTNTNYVDIVKNQLPQIPAENILAEPIPKNTAPCIGFAASVINKKYDDAIMMVLGAVQLFFIGFIGEYILAINQRVMKRPLVIEEKRINF